MISVTVVSSKNVRINRNLVIFYYLLKLFTIRSFTSSVQNGQNNVQYKNLFAENDIAYVMFSQYCLRDCLADHLRYDLFGVESSSWTLNFKSVSMSRLCL